MFFQRSASEPRRESTRRPGTLPADFEIMNFVTFSFLSASDNKSTQFALFSSCLLIRAVTG